MSGGFQLRESGVSPAGVPAVPWGLEGSVDFPAPPNPFTGALSTVRDAGIKYHGEANDRCHMTYAVRLHTSDAITSEVAELYMSTFVFSRCHPQVKALDIDFTQLRNISTLNTYLMCPEGRQRYGYETTCEKLLRDWRPLGFQVTNTDAALMRQRTEAAITVAVSHKARTPNVWLALGRSMEVGDNLFWVLRRHRFEAQGDSIGDGDAKGAEDEAEAEEDDASSSGGDAKAVDKKMRQPWYWRWEPYVSRTRKAPPHELYAETYVEKGAVCVEWVGTYLYVGQVTAFYGAQDPRRFAFTACKALFPASGEDYKKALSVLPVVETMYLVH